MIIIGIMCDYHEYFNLYCVVVLRCQSDTAAVVKLEEQCTGDPHHSASMQQTSRAHCPCGVQMQRGRWLGGYSGIP